MPTFEVHLTRPETSHRLVTVNAATPEAARRRALAINRGDQDPDEDAGEDSGDWCDAEVGRTSVKAVTEQPRSRREGA